ncbi:YheC/YheD family protein [Cohnella sp. WQ 127256]|uniref:YheC/YheD family protein n=1 Tax=Cohnella sp. WQ 127256 TaxID=2938790 RepID=UPI0021173B2A|nr:YheC/YheD family protein [Cohnella sp. WQ 127256]
MFVKKYKSKTLRGKLRVNRYLSSTPQLKHIVPKTVAFSKNNLIKMARKYKSLYIKPDIGSHGKGIFKMRRASKGYEMYFIEHKKQKINLLPSVRSSHRFVVERKKGKMIIQRGIVLDKLSGQPYDIRAMVQRKRGGAWTCTGIMAKVGKGNKIVTNVYQGGKSILFKELLNQQGYSRNEREQITQSLTNKALAVARVLSSRKSGMHEMGIDFAYDRNKRLWILEVNSNHPQFYPFKKLDRSMYERMRSYAKGYGRFDD